MVFLKAFILHLFTRLWKAGRSLFFPTLIFCPQNTTSRCVFTPYLLFSATKIDLFSETCK